MVKRIRVAKSVFVLITCLLTFILSACMSVTKHKVHHKILYSQQLTLPKKIIILPVSTTVRKLTAGGVVVAVKDWEDNVKSNVRHAIAHFAQQSGKYKIIAMPELNQQEKLTIAEHIALFNRVGGAALSIPEVKAWSEKHKHFDYSLGSGLSFLKKKTNADAAMIVYVRDIISTGGRKFAAFAGLALVGAFIPLGYSSVAIGIIDLESGDLLWINRVRSKSLSFRRLEDAKLHMANIMIMYPGIDQYRSAIK